MNEMVVLVDDNDNEVGYCEKIEAHRLGKLHRAFSVIICGNDFFDLLLQKREIHKYHSGGLWTNACCSHPKPHEDLESAVRRRVFEELGLDISDNTVYELYEIGAFKYTSRFLSFTENEIDHVFILRVNQYYDCYDELFKFFNPNKKEIEELKWFDVYDIEDLMVEHPDNFTDWFYAVYEMYVRKELDLHGTIGHLMTTECYSIMKQKLKNIQYNEL